MIDDIAELEPSAVHLLDSHASSIDNSEVHQPDRLTAVAVAMSALSLGVDSFSLGYLYGKLRFMHAQRQFIKSYNVRYPEDRITKEHSLGIAQAIVELSNIHSELKLK